MARVPAHHHAAHIPIGDRNLGEHRPRRVVAWAWLESENNTRDRPPSECVVEGCEDHQLFNPTAERPAANCDLIDDRQLPKKVKKARSHEPTIGQPVAQSDRDRVVVGLLKVSTDVGGGQPEEAGIELVGLLRKLVEPLEVGWLVDGDVDLDLQGGEVGRGRTALIAQDLLPTLTRRQIMDSQGIGFRLGPAEKTRKCTERPAGQGWVRRVKGAHVVKSRRHRCQFTRVVIQVQDCLGTNAQGRGHLPDAVGLRRPAHLQCREVILADWEVRPLAEQCDNVA